VSSRPTYHFTPGRGWINDPLGVTFRAGQVELFYQYVPDTTVWQASCQWGHATSTDLVTWEEQPVALAPGDGDEGCWSGCIVADANVLLYTSVGEPDRAIGRVRAARSDDDSWQRWTKGPFVVDPPADLAVSAFRDPFVWRDGEQWRMLVGAGLPGGVGAALSYASPDLATWSYDGIFAQRATSERDGCSTGSIWECPQLVRIDAEDYLVVSVWDDHTLKYVAGVRGALRAGRFETIGAWQQLTHGSYYAGTGFVDDDGHAGLLHWLREVGDPADGWMGALSVPHRLSSEDGLLVARPHPRVAAARRRLLVEDQPVADGFVLHLPSWHCEVVVDLGSTAGPVDLRWRDGPDAPARLTLTVHQAEHRWTLAALGATSLSDLCWTRSKC